jgi:GNAT superfamily N-acetyltransferase
LIDTEIQILEARPADAREIAALHFKSRGEAMPDWTPPLTDDELTTWFLHTVAKTPGIWWVARHRDRIVGYMVLQDEDVGHLYVLPGWQGRGVGSHLLDKAKELSPRRLTLLAFERNAKARDFYEAREFRPVGSIAAIGTFEPNLEYVWEASEAAD